jgi:sterol desaturase/sphingolipid hydroxylase (fatty acid hydroxylase superfamily)
MLLTIPGYFEHIGNDRFIEIVGFIIPAWALFMIILEHLFPYTEGIRLFRRGFWTDLVWYTLVQSKILQLVIFTYIILNVKNALGLNNYGLLSHWNYWLLLSLFLVTHDFYIYWFHRLQHHHKWFWRTHEAHHSLREVDWLAGSRSHFIEIMINQTIEFIPIFFLLDANTAAFVYPVKALIDATWGMWIHANINVKSSKLQYIINGPEMHQWHHANHEEVFFKNFATKLAFWDWIFGTGYLPGLKPIKAYFTKPVMFGLPYAFPNGYFAQMVYSIRRFNIFDLNRNVVCKAFFNIRKNAFSSFLSWFGVKRTCTIQSLFDPRDAKYAIDSSSHQCPKCQTSMKYFYTGYQMVKICENCAHDTEKLRKFN